MISSTICISRHAQAPGRADSKVARRQERFDDTSAKLQRISALAEETSTVTAIGPVPQRCSLKILNTGQVHNPHETNTCSLDSHQKFSCESLGESASKLHVTEFWQGIKRLRLANSKHSLRPQSSFSRWARVVCQGEVTRRITALKRLGKTRIALIKSVCKSNILFSPPLLGHRPLATPGHRL